MKTESTSRIDLPKAADILMSSQKPVLKRVASRLIKEKENQISGHTSHSAGGTHTKSNL